MLKNQVSPLRGLILYSFLLLFSSSVLAANPIPADRTDFWFDFLKGDFLGAQPVTPDTDRFVRSLVKELNLPFEKTLRIRRLSQYAIYYGGMTHLNACATSFGGNDYLFISEQWFKTLSDEQKRFLIGHELMHLFCEHEEKRGAVLLGGSLITLSTTGAFLYYFRDRLSWGGRWFGAIALYLTSRTVVDFFLKRLCRSQEFEADREAALRLNCIDGGIGIMRLFIAFEQSFEADCSNEEWCKKKRSFLKWLKRPFLSHPSSLDRLKQLEMLKRRAERKR